MIFAAIAAQWRGSAVPVNNLRLNIAIAAVFPRMYNTSNAVMQVWVAICDG